MSPAVVDALLGRMKGHLVDLSVPKFRLAHDFLLAEPLQDLGIRSAFSPQANLSGMFDSRERQRLGMVIHKSYFDISEEAAEAAAATGVSGITQISFPAPLDSARVVLDRPFLFLIRDNETGAILFLGRLTNPRT